MEKIGVNLIDGRGQNKKILQKMNFEKVVEWLKNNPNKTIKELCAGTGLSYKTVKAHLNAIKNI